MEEQILGLFAEKGAMKSAEVAAAAGAPKPDVDKIIKKLVKEGKVYSPKRCYYDVQK